MAVNRTELAIRYIAPAALVAVALTQFYLAHAHGLTPWKGGGFGMFSTVDSPSARFLRCYISLPEGEVPAPIPSGNDRAILRLRAMPSNHALREAAKDIARRPWVPYEYEKREPGELNCKPPLPAVCYAAPPGCPQSSKPRYRALLDEEPPPPPSVIIPVSAVRLELWRYRFDIATKRMVSERLMLARVETPHRSRS